jgi:hypothetical protein
MPHSETVPHLVRRVVDTSLRLLVRVDQAAERGSAAGQRLSGRLVLPAPRRAYDEL